MIENWLEMALIVGVATLLGSMLRGALGAGTAARLKALEAEHAKLRAGTAALEGERDAANLRAEAMQRDGQRLKAALTEAAERLERSQAAVAAFGGDVAALRRWQEHTDRQLQAVTEELVRRGGGAGNPGQGGYPAAPPAYPTMPGMGLMLPGMHPQQQMPPHYGPGAGYMPGPWPTMAPAPYAPNAPAPVYGGAPALAPRPPAAANAPEVPLPSGFVTMPMPDSTIVPASTSNATLASGEAPALMSYEQWRASSAAPAAMPVPAAVESPTVPTPAEAAATLAATEAAIEIPTPRVADNVVVLDTEHGHGRSAKSST